VKGWGNMAVFTDGNSMWLDTYEKVWRAWLLREPTDMEQKNAPEWKV
jgi:hypothetical protein